MAKLIIMRGLPASGKSTRAKEMVAQYKNTVRINKDLLRTMLHFDTYSGINERITQEVEKSIARELLRDGKTIIVDDTNLNPKTRESWKQLAKEEKLDEEEEFIVEDMGTPLLTCLIRDASREKRVGSHVIYKMALQFTEQLVGMKVIICDLDGTLCDIKHRLHHVQEGKKDWQAFFVGIPKDTLRSEVAKQIHKLQEETKAEIILVSARPENYRTITEEWLQKRSVPYMTLIMRRAGDKRPDTEVKEEIYEKYLKRLDIVKVFDDRPSVIRMWREKGLDVEDVGDGIEF